MEVHHISVPKTARYYSLGTPGKHIKKYWLVCHGYGQPAERFIQKFESILDEETLVIAPEGLSRFYWEKFSGNVVASWMTKEDRLSEIADFSSYLTRLNDLFIPQLSDGVQVNLMGFSQGVATQLRWIDRALPNFDNLILWAGSIPRDIDYKMNFNYWQGKQVHYVYGTQDPFITQKHIDNTASFTDTLPFQLKVTSFDGPHRVVREVLSDLVKSF